MHHINRRQVLATSAVGAVTHFMNADAANAAADDDTIIVDTHMHTWSGDLNRWPFAHPYSEDVTPPKNPATVERLIDDLDANHVSNAVIVQTIFHGWDNTYTVHSVAQAPDRFKGHGLIDPQDPRVADKLDYWMSEHGLAGMRFSPIYYVEGANGGDEWITSRAHHKLWRKAEKLRAVFNMFIHNTQLPRLGMMLDRYPDARVIVDHVSQIDLADDDAQAQLDRLLALSKHPNVWVKVTDLTSVSPSKTYPFAKAMPYIEQVYQAFGSDRLLWGTGYPGATRTEFQRPCLKMELELVKEQFSFMSALDKRKYLGLNAKDLWGF